jgi:hypothetical protein
MRTPREFANLVGVPVKTLQNREQVGRGRLGLLAPSCGRSPKTRSMSCGRLQLDGPFIYLTRNRCGRNQSGWTVGTAREFLELVRS